MRKFNCYSFFDFYMIESIKFNLSQVEEARTFLPSYQYLKDKVQEVEENFIPAFAEVLRDYLWYASLGEARHGGVACDGVIYNLRDDNPSNSFSRGHVYSHIAEKYPPTDYNVALVDELFNNHHWKGSYGGPQWGTISTAVMRYKEWDNTTFIDHCADLQHNGGVAFNKSGIPFWDIKGYSKLMNFLQFKFNADNLLADLPDMESNPDWWSDVLSKDILFLINKTLHMTGEFPIQWEMKGRTHIPMNFKRYNYSLEHRYTQDRSLDYIRSMDSCHNCSDPIFEGTGGPADGWDDSILFCDGCLNSCDDCGKTICDIDTMYIDGGSICKDCYDKNYVDCSNCGESRHKQNVNEDGECESCVSKRCKICEKHTNNSHSSYRVTMVDNYTIRGSDSLSRHETKICSDCMRAILISGYDVRKTTEDEIMVSENGDIWDNPYRDLYHVSLNLVEKMTVYDLPSNVEEQESILSVMKESEAWVA